MSLNRIEVPPEAAGSRADVFLASALSGLSRAAAQRLLDDGSVCLDGRPIRKNLRLGGGETLEVELPEARDSAVEPEQIPLDIVYEDDDVIVIDKPRGMVVHPAAGHENGTLVNALLAHCGGSLSGIGGEKRPGIVHRIDKDTSGLLIVAKNDRAHQSLSEQLKTRSLSRVYDAVVVGGLREDTGTVDAPIGRSPRDRKKMAVVPGGRPAVTHYCVQARYDGYTHVRCKLETGRTHQIRVHMAYIGHPVAGDPLYGPKNDRTGLGGQCLHARELTFVHPASGETICVSCPLPPYFTAFLQKISRGEWYEQI